MRRPEVITSLALLLPVLVMGGVLTSTGALSWGQVACWLAFLAALTSSVAGLGVLVGRPEAAPVARAAFRVQWLGLLGGAVFLWWILFHHQFQYQYVHDYSSRDMPSYYVYAAFWGGQEGTFLLWALISTTLGLRRWVFGLPDFIGRVQGLVMDFVPGKPFSTDNYRSLLVDSVCRQDGLGALGITAQPMEAIVRQYLGAHSAHGLLDGYRHLTGRG